MTSTQPTCVLCGMDDSQAPLVRFQYQGQTYWVCTKDFPTLIHRPQMLAGKLPGAERITPGEHDH
ncbi:MAG TPA: hypothetical protein PLV53_07350 [Anaerolineaceae bacterium]|nr:hypothetical protein [Anaerolineaceae bacterium]